jgi:hypothetical protein
VIVGVHALAAGRLVNPFGVTLPSDAAFYVVTLHRPRHPAHTAAVKAWLLSHREWRAQRPHTTLTPRSQPLTRAG